MLAAPRLHTRNSRLGGADLVRHLGLGQTLRGPRLQELVQKGKLNGQLFVFRLYLSIAQSFGAELFMCQHFSIPSFVCAQLPIL